MRLTPVAPHVMPETDILFQSGFWAAFREKGENRSLAFLTEANDVHFPLVVLTRTGVSGDRYAYVPRGPAGSFDEEDRGIALETVAEALRPWLPDDTVCVRFDTGFPSAYIGHDYWTDKGHWRGAPRAEIREMRMNAGTKHGRLRKAPLDHLSPDTVIIDLDCDDRTLLGRMRQTTRNCVRRSLRSDLEFRRGGIELLDSWHRLYADTAERKKFYGEGKPYFERLFTCAAEYDERQLAFLEEGSGQTTRGPEFQIFSAWMKGHLVAGALTGISGRSAYYLYAGSSTEYREYMANYGLQWHIMDYARSRGCVQYDLMGVPPNGDPNHSMYGLYTFKTGLGGHVVHYAGCWDYPYDASGYSRLRNAENLG